jgi:hypothetical protein
MRMKQGLGWACLVLCGLGGLASPVYAQNVNPKQQADVHFRNGVALYGEGKHAEALAEFERAQEIAPHPLLYYNIAITYRAMSRYDQALLYLEKFLAEGTGKVSKKQLQRGSQEFSELAAFVARVTVTTKPDGVLVRVQDVFEGVTPLPRDLVLGPGRHTIVATKAGYETIEREVMLASADQIAVEIELRALPEPEVVGAAVDSTRPVATEAPRRFGLTAGFGTNVRDIADNGAPFLGASVNLPWRFSASVDAVLVAYAMIPTLRYRLFGDAFSAHLQGSVPIVFKDGEMTETFTAVSGGLMLRYQFNPWGSLRLEGTVAYAGSERPVTIPVIVGTEVWF